MTIDLYLIPPSPPCRSVLLLAKHLGIDANLFNIKNVNLLTGEHLKPEFVAVNPAHTVPTIVDHETNLTLWESRAIMGYLVDKYAPDNDYYPKDPVKRAVINKWLYFDNGSFFPALGKAFRPLIFEGAEQVDPVSLAELKDKLKLFDTLLAHQGTKFAAGDNVTIADLALAVSLDMPVHLIPLDVSEFKTVDAWYKSVKESVAGYKEICDDVLEGFKTMLDERKSAAAAEK